MMLAYAAARPVISRGRHPNTLLLIIGGHVALVAAVMSAKMEIQRKPPEPPLIIDTIKTPTPPPPRPIRTERPIRQIDSWVDRPQPQIPIQPTTIDPGPAVDPGPIAGAGTSATIEVPRPTVTPVKSDARLLTPDSELKPPYPAAKLLSEEEAVLRLKLTIDAQGRVIAVDPVGRADPAFLDAARRHLIAHWRYRPASEGGRAVASTVFITLHFELDG